MSKVIMEELRALRVPFAMALLMATLLIWATDPWLPQYWWGVPVMLSAVLLAKPLFQAERLGRVRRKVYGRAVLEELGLGLKVGAVVAAHRVLSPRSRQLGFVEWFREAKQESREVEFEVVPPTQNCEGWVEEADRARQDEEPPLVVRGRSEFVDRDWSPAHEALRKYSDAQL